MTPVDPASGTRSFTVRDALSSGLTTAMLRHPRYERPFHGVRKPAVPKNAAAPVREVVMERALDFLPVLRPGEAFSHESALLLLGCPIRCAPRLHVTSPSSLKPHAGSGVVGHAAQELSSLSLLGLPIVSPQRALLQASETLPLRELVVAADHLILPGRTGGSGGLVSLEDLRAAALGSSQRGVRRARTALSFVRLGAQSRMETLLRLIMASHRLDVLELQIDVFDGDGRWIGRFDMVDRERKLIIEYDGEQHRNDRAQYLKDQYRLDRARAAGYRILHLHKEDLLHRPYETARRIAEFLDLPLQPLRQRLLHELIR